MKIPHFILIGLVVVGCSTKKSSDETIADSTTNKVDSLQNPTAAFSRIEVESGIVNVVIDNKTALRFDLGEAQLFDNQSNDTTLYASFNIDEDKGSALREVSFVFTASKNWVESEYLNDVKIEDINNIKWQTSWWDLPDMQSDTRIYQYRFDDGGYSFVFQLTISASTYTDPEENVQPGPFDENKYIARFESFLGTVEQD